MNIDNNFGKWTDKTSNFLYYESFKEIIKKIVIPERVADYGGANGIIKQFISQAISIDINADQNPDIVDNILTHTGNYDLIIIRYVLHYLNDYDVIRLFEHIKTFHKERILIVRFCNNDLISKYHNSINEFKYFRTEQQLEALLPEHSIIYRKRYLCSAEFYKYRLNNENGISHYEILKGFYI